MHLHIRREKPAFHIDLLLFCICGQGLNFHWPEIYIEVKKHTKLWNSEKTCFIIQTEYGYRCKTKPQFLSFSFFVFRHSCSHFTLFVVSMAEEALMGFSFHLSFGEEAYGHTTGVWSHTFGSMCLAIQIAAFNAPSWSLSCCYCIVPISPWWICSICIFSCW